MSLHDLVSAQNHAEGMVAVSPFNHQCLDNLHMQIFDLSIY